VGSSVAGTIAEHPDVLLKTMVEKELGLTGELDATGELAMRELLAGRAPDGDLERGDAAVRGLPASLLRLGVERLAAGSDDAATLVPEYVMLPRGVRDGLDVGEGVSWSYDRP